MKIIDILWIIPLPIYIMAIGISMPPLIDKSMIDYSISIPDGKYGYLTCTASGIPNPIYEWYHNGRILMNKDGVNIQDVSLDGRYSSQLNITNINGDTDGYYQCSARNDFGTDMSDKMRVIHIKPINYDNQYTKISVNVNDYVEIKCPGLPDEYKPEYNWYIDNGERKKWITIVEDERYRLDDEGSLYITSVKDNDFHINGNEKIYVRGAYIPSISKDIFTCRSILKKSQGSVMKEQKLLYKSKKHYNVGSDARLYCIYSGNPEIHWMKNDRPISGVYAQRLSYLLLRNVSFKDSGVYKCIAAYKNADKTVETEIELNVYQKPVFKLPGMLSQNVTTGEIAEFICPITTKDSVSWFVDGVLIDQYDERVVDRIKFVQHTSPLLVSQVIACNASNVHGYVYSSAYLKVLDKTEFTIKPKDRIIDSKDIILSCSAKSDPSTPVHYYWSKVIYGEQDVLLSDDDSYIITASDIGSELTIKVKDEDLIKGRYRCIASNSYSTIKAGVTLNIAKASSNMITKEKINLTYILLPIFIMFIILIIIIISTIFYRRRESAYDVDKKERAMGNDPLKEIADSGFHDFNRTGTMKFNSNKGSMGSIGGTLSMNNSGKDEVFEEISLDTKNFNEDTSFVGNFSDSYNNALDRRKNSSINNNKNGNGSDRETII